MIMFVNTEYMNEIIRKYEEIMRITEIKKHII